MSATSTFVRPLLAGACALAAPLLMSFAVFGALAPRAAAQKKEELRINDGRNCPYCRADPERMQRAGILSHGGFEFGKTDTAKVDAILPEAEIRWIETKNFKIGFGLGAWKVKLEEKKKYLAELTKLQQVLPDVKPESTIIDPWLRLHLYAQRAEEIHARFVELLSLQNMTFPTGPAQWQKGGEYFGEGPFLGMQRKFEWLVVPSESTHVAYLTAHAGLRIKKSQRWHYVELGSIQLVCHTQEGQLRNDAALHGHLGFNLAHNLYDGLFHYNYDTPVWLHEGFAHFMEREINPKHNSFDSDEGAIANDTSKENWKPEVLKLINAGTAPRMAELVTIKRFSELTLPIHFTTWSMIDFLVQTRPLQFGKFLVALKRNFNADGIPSNENLGELHRQKFKEILGMNYQEFDLQWRTWALDAYKPGVPKGGEGLGGGGTGMPAPGSLPPPPEGGGN